MAISSACFFGILRTQIGASVQFSRMVRCGNRLKCWNTMPTSRRTSSIFLRSLVSSMPSTMILPFWCSSSRLMQRIIVDLPEPDGPQMTMRSPRMTLRLMSFSTWNSPYHLLHADDLDRDIGVGDLHLASVDLDLFGADGVLDGHAACSRFYRLWPVSSRRSMYMRIARHAEAEHPEHQRGEDQAGDRRLRRRPVRVGEVLAAPMPSRSNMPMM